jgi:hypothetical protein
MPWPIAKIMMGAGLSGLSVFECPLSTVRPKALNSADSPTAVQGYIRYGAADECVSHLYVVSFPAMRTRKVHDLLP